MIPGASSHRAEHWLFFNGGMRFDSDVRDPEFADFYGPAQREEIRPYEAFLEDWLARTVELVDHNRPQLVWFDWWIEQTSSSRGWRGSPRSTTTGASPATVRWPSTTSATRSRPDQPSTTSSAGEAAIRPMVWQNDTSVALNSWGWVEGQQYKDIRVILGDLLDVVSKNGAFLLNVGPKPDGSFEPEESELLCRIGDWLTVNGEAIYGTRPLRSVARVRPRSRTPFSVTGPRRLHR